MLSTDMPEENLLGPAQTADLELRIPATIQGPKRIENAKGLLWVTDRRVSLLQGAWPCVG